LATPRAQQRQHEPEDALTLIVERLKAFFVKNVLHIALAIAVLLVIGVVVRTYMLRRGTVTTLQWQRLGELSGTAFPSMLPKDQAEAVREAAIKQCRAILADEPETSATPWVLLKLGGLLAAKQEWAQAAETFERLIRDYPESEAARIARPSLCATLEAMGRYKEAAEAYQKLADQGRSHYLLDVGRCRELAGDAEAARRAYSALDDSDAPAELRALARARLGQIAEGRLLTPPPEPKRPKEDEKPAEAAEKSAASAAAEAQGAPSDVSGTGGADQQSQSSAQKAGQSH